MLNVIIATGRLVDAPELRKTNSDKSLLQFTIAIDNTRKEADGTRGTAFLDCVYFTEKAGEFASSLHKGSKIAIHGSLNQRNFTRQDGSKGKAFEIAVNSLEFLDPKPQVEEDEEPVEEQPKFDPYTGKPLKPKAKK